MVSRRSVDVDGLYTSYLEAGTGPTVVLLHGGEFGGNAEACWERTLPVLARDFRVVAPDLLGFGDTAKVVDFVDGRRRRLQHLARFCEILGLSGVPFVGNSMGGMLALFAAAQPQPLLPASAVISITGGGELTRSPHTDAMFDYDGSFEGMRRIVAALFHSPEWPADYDYVRRRHIISTAPGAWEAVAAARFRRPDLTDAEPPVPRMRSASISYDSIGLPTLILEGAEDKIKPRGWSKVVADAIPDGRHVQVAAAGHCPQLENPDATNPLLKEFLLEVTSGAPQAQ